MSSQNEPGDTLLFESIDDYWEDYQRSPNYLKANTHERRLMRHAFIAGCITVAGLREHPLVDMEKVVANIHETVERESGG